jgi:hypothetical protein
LPDHSANDSELLLFELGSRTVGLLYTVLCLLLLILAFRRNLRSEEDFSDAVALGVRYDGPEVTSTMATTSTRGDSTPSQPGSKPKTVTERRYGRAFKTSGVEVAVVSALVLATQGALLGLILAV